MATRCCSPPDNRSGKVCAGQQADRLEQLFGALPAAVFSNPFNSSGQGNVFPDGESGNEVEELEDKANFLPAEEGPVWSSTRSGESRPARSIHRRPRSIPLIRLSRVVFPLPLLPRMATNSPLLKHRSAPCRTTLFCPPSRYDLERLSRHKNWVCGLLCAASRVFVNGCLDWSNSSLSSINECQSENSIENSPTPLTYLDDAFQRTLAPPARAGVPVSGENELGRRCNAVRAQNKIIGLASGMR